MCINNQVLKNNDHGPLLIENEKYLVKEVYTDADGYDHIDVGVVSRLNWVSCYETKKPIPRGDKIHWCHPVRFVKI
jgi:hypothetical protein